MISRTASAVLACALLLAAIPGAALADMFPPSHYCSKPSKPYQFSSQWEVDSFKEDIRRYRRCIEDFVEEQQQAARSHMQAADDAIEDWNRFVNYELN